MDRAFFTAGWTVDCVETDDQIKDPNQWKKMKSYKTET